MAKTVKKGGTTPPSNPGPGNTSNSPTVPLGFTAPASRRGGGRPATSNAPTVPLGVRAAKDLASEPVQVVFCDIGGVLGDPVFSPPPPKLRKLDVFPAVAKNLARLRKGGFRLGVISNTGEEKPKTVTTVLDKAGLLTFFEPSLLIYSSEVGVTKRSTKIFTLAAERAGLAANPAGCLFVGENSSERGVAAKAGFRVAADLATLTIPK